MDFGISAILIMVFIIIYYMLIQVFSVLFRISGLTKVKAKFQVISLLTNSGFTTSESEIVVTDKLRRKLWIGKFRAGLESKQKIKKIWS